MFMIWDSRQQDWQLFWLSFEHCYKWAQITQMNNATIYDAACACPTAGDKEIADSWS